MADPDQDFIDTVNGSTSGADPNQDFIDAVNKQYPAPEFSPQELTPSTDQAASETTTEGLSGSFGWGTPRTQEQYQALHGRGLPAAAQAARAAALFEASGKSIFGEPSMYQPDPTGNAALETAKGYGNVAKGLLGFLTSPRGLAEAGATALFPPLALPFLGAEVYSQGGGAAGLTEQAANIGKAATGQLPPMESAEAGANLAMLLAPGAHFLKPKVDVFRPVAPPPPGTRFEPMPFGPDVPPPPISREQTYQGIQGDERYAIQPGDAQVRTGETSLGEQAGAGSTKPLASSRDYAIGEGEGAATGGIVPQPVPASEALAATVPKELHGEGVRPVEATPVRLTFDDLMARSGELQDKILRGEKLTPDEQSEYDDIRERLRQNPPDKAKGLSTDESQRLAELQQKLIRGNMGKGPGLTPDERKELDYLKVKEVAPEAAKPMEPFVEGEFTKLPDAVLQLQDKIDAQRAAHQRGEGPPPSLVDTQELARLKTEAQVPEVARVAAPEDMAELDALHSHWSTLNNDLLRYRNQPFAPAALKLVTQQQEVNAKMHALKAKLPGGEVGDVGVIGGGPAGIGAAINGPLEGVDVSVHEAQAQTGGASRFTSRLENVTGGPPMGETGRQRAWHNFNKALRAGAQFLRGQKIVKAEFNPNKGAWTVTTKDGKKSQYRAVIANTGQKFRELTGRDGKPVPGAEMAHIGNGEATMAEAGKGEPILILGGSNAAAQAALAAASEGHPVTIMARAGWSMSDYQVRQVMADDSIIKITNDQVSKIEGEKGKMKTVTTTGGKVIRTKSVGGFLGGTARSEWLPDYVLKNDKGEIITNGKNQALMRDANGKEVPVPGLYAAGTIRADSINRVLSSEAEGQRAITFAGQYIDSLRNEGKLPSWKTQEKAFYNRTEWTGETIPPTEKETTPSPQTKQPSLPRETPTGKPVTQPTSKNTAPSPSSSQTGAKPATEPPRLTREQVIARAAMEVYNDIPSSQGVGKARFETMFGFEIPPEAEARATYKRLFKPEAAEPVAIPEADRPYAGMAPKPAEDIRPPVQTKTSPGTPDREALGWNEATKHGRDWIENGGNISQVIQNFRNTGKINSWDMGKLSAQLEKLQNITNDVGDALRKKPNDKALQKAFNDAATKEDAFREIYDPINNIAKDTLPLEGHPPINETQAESVTGLARRFNEIRKKPMSARDEMEAAGIASKQKAANEAYGKANGEIYKVMGEEFDKIKTDRKVPPTDADLGKTFTQMKDVC